MKRLDFLKRISTIAVIGIPTVALIDSCSTTIEPVPLPEKDCLANGTDTTIGNNHGHDLTVSKNDVEVGTAKTYNIAGSASHDHQVTISEANFASLKNTNTAIQVTSSSDDGHTHSVSVSCA